MKATDLKVPRILPHYSETVRLKDKSTAKVRTARPEDVCLLPQYFADFTDEDLRQRFFFFDEEVGSCRMKAEAFYRTTFEEKDGLTLVVIGEALRLEGVGRATFLYESDGAAVYELSFSTRKKGNGAGSALMTGIVRWAQGMKKPCNLIAATTQSNKRMHWLLARFGFHERECFAAPHISEFLRKI